MLKVFRTPVSIAFFVLLFCEIFFVSFFAVGQTDVFISVEGEVKSPEKFTIEMLSAMPTLEINVSNREGNQDTYSGVRISDILVKAGATLGTDLRGENLAKYLIVEALDGYEAVFSLPEIDPEFTDQISIVAFNLNGEPLPVGMGPFRIIIPHEKRQARWVREVKSLKILYANN